MNKFDSLDGKFHDLERILSDYTNKIVNNELFYLIVKGGGS